MAEAYGKLTGRPGLCMVTRGPGATHASVGVHTAFQDGTPLIVMVGQVPRGQRGREAFQELDYEAVFGSMTKWVVEIDDPGRIPELVDRAFRTATSGRPGPVVLALPEDMLTERTSAPDAVAAVPAQAEPGEGDVERARELLDGCNAAPRARRGTAVGRRGARHARRVVRAERSAGRFGLEVPGLHRQPLAVLRRPPRAGGRPPSRRAARGRRRAARARQRVSVTSRPRGSPPSCRRGQVAGSSTCHPASRSSVASMHQSLGSSRRGLGSRRALARLPTLDPAPRRAAMD